MMDELVKQLQSMDWMLEGYGTDAVIAANDAAREGASLHEQHLILNAHGENRPMPVLDVFYD